MSTPPKPPASNSLAPPPLPVLVPQLPITPVRHDKDKENCFSPSALLLPCFRLVTPELQIALEPMDRRQAQLQYIDYKLNALQGKHREGRKRRNINCSNEKSTSEHHSSSHDAATAQHTNHASIARDRENRPQQPRLTSPPKHRYMLTTTTSSTTVSYSPPPPPPTQPQTQSLFSGGVSMAGVTRKPLLPKFPPTATLIAKANSATPSRQRRA